MQLFLAKMSWSDKIYKAPPNSGNVILERTVPSLLDEACDRAPNPHAFHQWTEEGWKTLSNQSFRSAAEEVALGLLHLGLERGDRIALLMQSDVNFCIADMGCLLAKLIDVPIDLTQTLENIVFILQHTEAKALIISNLDLFYQIVPFLRNAYALNTTIVANVLPDWQHSTCQPTINKFAHCIQVFSLEEVRAQGHQIPHSQRQKLRSALLAHDLATIIYVPGATGELQGVMLTHENLSANALAMFTGIPGLELGEREIALSFLPLTHVFARVSLYGHINYGHSLYFTTPNRVMKHLKEVQPTIFAAVPLLLEKIYSKILEKGRQLEHTQRIFNWTLHLAQQYELGQRPQARYALMLKLIDRLVFSRWRSVFGHRLKYLICGGAALKAEIANLFAAAGVTILQGYGLTETSSAVACNRGQFNRAGTVGVPLAGVEIAIADDSEILVRGPYVTQGYYKNPVATQQAIDAEGWFHTGDLGEITADGFLKITGLKKSLFKLSSGKYVTPQPLENKLEQSPLVAKAIAVGAGRKFCAMLILPDLDFLHRQAQSIGLNLPTEELLKHPRIIALYQALIDEANCHLPYWSTVKRFQLVNATLTVENGLLTATGEVRRAKVSEVFAKELDVLYAGGTLDATQRIKSLSSCPAYAQSLTSLTT